MPLARKLFATSLIAAACTVPGALLFSATASAEPAPAPAPILPGLPNLPFLSGLSPAPPRRRRTPRSRGARHRVHRGTRSCGSGRAGARRHCVRHAPPGARLAGCSDRPGCSSRAARNGRAGARPGAVRRGEPPAGAAGSDAASPAAELPRRPDLADTCRNPAGQPVAGAGRSASSCARALCTGAGDNRAGRAEVGPGGAGWGGA